MECTDTWDPTRLPVQDARGSVASPVVYCQLWCISITVEDIDEASFCKID